MISFLLENGYLVAGQVGLLFGFVLFGITLRKSLWQEAQLYTPEQFQAEQLKAHPPGPDGIGPDLAWPLYMLRQADVDRVLVRRNLRALYGRMWKWPLDTFYKGYHGPRWAWWILLFPVPVSVNVFLLTGGLSAWFSYWVYWTVVGAGKWTDRTVGRLVRQWMRVAEARRRTMHHAQAACMECMHVTQWPAYRCPSCASPHHDVSPGRLGTFVRRCVCGASFPTLASRAAWRTTAECKRCKKALPDGAGAVRDIRIPVFGDTKAGKTRFLYASLNSLMADAELAGVPITFPDQAIGEEVRRGRELIKDGRNTPKTSPGIGRVAITLRLRRGQQSDLIHMFDAAGEDYSEAQKYEKLRFLDDSQGLAYVLDPFSVQAIREQLGDQLGDLLVAAQAAENDPDLAYGEVISRLRDGGVRVSTQRLAVVVSKADLLRRAGLDIPSDSAAIEDWLIKAGLQNLVLAMGREFAEVRYFAVASLDVSTSFPDEPGVPLRWLLTAHGVRLPADTAFQLAQSRA
jgi:hypothetical protein